MEPRLSTSKKLILGLQHMFAMFGATVLVPMITGLDISTTLLFAGLGTLFFHFATRRKVPAFLGSSFAYLGAFAAVAPLIDGKSNTELLPYACFGVAVSSILYFLLAFGIKTYGTSKIMKFFPPVVTGPIIVAIGLTLAGSAVNNCATDWLIALVAIILVCVCNVFGKGMIKIVPIIIGVIGSYLLAIFLGRVDFTPVTEATWIGFPIHYNNTVFSIFTNGNIMTGVLITSIVTILPYAIPTIVEHIGDISAISETAGKNFIKEPGLHKTLIGDGGATLLASLFGAPANTTYGENTAVLNLTKVYDPIVMEIAAGFAVLFSFSPKFASIIYCMPTATIGGISIILYGMISAVGFRNIKESEVDFKDQKNQLIIALIIGLSVGITYSSIGAISFSIGTVTISLSGLAVGSLVGIIVNAIFKLGKDDTEDKLNISAPLTITDNTNERS